MKKKREVPRGRVSQETDGSLIKVSDRNAEMRSSAQIDYESGKSHCLLVNRRGRRVPCDFSFLIVFSHQ